MITRKVTVKLDRGGKPFVKFKHFEERLIIQPGVAECWGGRDIPQFKEGDKVLVSHWNKPMGFFMVKKAGDTGTHEIWQGPRYNNQLNEWVYDK